MYAGPDRPESSLRSVCLGPRLSFPGLLLEQSIKIHHIQPEQIPAHFCISFVPQTCVWKINNRICQLPLQAQSLLAKKRDKNARKKQGRKKANLQILRFHWTRSGLTRVTLQLGVSSGKSGN
jgi:hypothetical protein